MDNSGHNALVTGTDDTIIAPLRGGPAGGAGADQPLVAPQGCSPADYDMWHLHWWARGQPWRTETEIETSRQVELDHFRMAPPDAGFRRYPFGGFRLGRADIEWLLATRQGGAGQLDPGDRTRGARGGMDLRGADLAKARLAGLPLSGMLGGLPGDEWLLATDAQREMASVHLERADLCGADLCGADLCGADLRGAHLCGADLRGAHLEGAVLCQAHLEGARDFSQPADLRGAFFDSATRLEGVSWGNKRYGFVPFADLHWGDVNLAEVDWTSIDRLGDEYEIHWRLPVEYQRSIRANRQLAAALRARGLRADADHFAYRACVNQCSLRLQQAVLPVVLRVFVRERMPLPKVLLRLEERRQGQRMPRHPLGMALLRSTLSLLVVVVLALPHPVALGALPALGVLLLLAVLPTMRQRRLQPLQYRRSQKPLPPPGLLPQRHRRRQQWLLLLGFLLGMPKSELPLLLGPAAGALPRVPVLGRLWAHRRNRPVLAILAPLLVLVLLFDDTLVCYWRFAFSYLLGVLTGHGYKMVRSFCWYLVLVWGFAALYYVSGHLQPQAAFLLSLASFHGYGFLVGSLAIDRAVTAEAVVGLIVEVCVVATLMRRLLDR